jgi:hypothetical protein
MSDDIVERLRSWRHDSWPSDPSFDAAAEIERLRARVAVLESDRRERIATACLAALLSHDGWERMSVPYLVQHAVGYADELIAELGREVKP